MFIRREGGGGAGAKNHFRAIFFFDFFFCGTHAAAIDVFFFALICFVVKQHLVPGINYFWHGQFIVLTRGKEGLSANSQWSICAHPQAVAASHHRSHNGPRQRHRGSGAQPNTFWCVHTLKFAPVVCVPSKSY